MISNSNIAAFLALFATSTVASPIAVPDPQGLAPVPVCSVLEYRNLKQSAPYDAEARLASGMPCTSNKDEDCELTNGRAFAINIEKSISTNAGGGLDIGRIFSLGLDVGFTYTWGTSDEQSQSVTVKCPPGGLTCNVMGIAKVLNITGEAKATSDPLKGTACFQPTDKWEPFEMVVPFEEENSDGLGPVVKYQACLLECGDDSDENFPDSCQLDAAQKLPDCPTKIPRNTMKDKSKGRGAFGGEVGFIVAPWANAPQRRA